MMERPASPLDQRPQLRENASILGPVSGIPLTSGHLPK
jgi:hypothetical protein